MYDEDEVPNDFANPITFHEVKEHVPSHMQNMMKYLPQELQNNFKTLLTPTKQTRQKKIPMPNHKKNTLNDTKTTRGCFGSKICAFKGWGSIKIISFT